MTKTSFPYTQQKRGNWYHVKRQPGKANAVWTPLGGDPASDPDAMALYKHLIAGGEAPRARQNAIRNERQKAIRSLIGDGFKVRECGRADFVNVFRRARKRSVLFGREFTITVEDVMDMAERGGLRCALSGLPFVYTEPKVGYRQPFAPSLDRMDPKGGYTPDNSRLVCVAINALKLDWTDDVVRRVCAAVVARGLEP